MVSRTVALRRWLPIDPDYAPFGWRWLRGLNALAFSIYVPYMLGRGLWDFKVTVSFRESQGFWAAFGEAAARLPGMLLMAVVSTMMLMLATVVVINLTENLPIRWRLASLGGALVAAAILYRPLSRMIALAFGSWVPSDFLTPDGRYLDPHTLPFKFGVVLTNPRTVSVILEAVAFGCLAAAPIYLRRRRQQRIRALREAKLQSVQAQSQELEARLQSLQAQIEPHFLFNTLAHIMRLHQVDAERGRQMLRSLTDYMRSALPQMRGADFTLGRELALTRSYVEVQQIRMGERLHVEFDVPAELLDARVPPMTVLTLAENAVKHGLGPKAEGGTLRIEARRHGDTLEVAVSDDGVGLQLGAGTGHGLSNIRSRLEAAYGSRASLELGNRDSGGVRAVLLLPLAPVAAAELVS